MYYKSSPIYLQLLVWHVFDKITSYFNKDWKPEWNGGFEDVKNSKLRPPRRNQIWINLLELFLVLFTTLYWEVFYKNSFTEKN